MALTAALLVPWLSASGWLQNCHVAAGNLAGRVQNHWRCIMQETEYWHSRGKGYGLFYEDWHSRRVQVVLPFDVIVFLRLTGVLQRLTHQLESLRWACASYGGLVTCMWAEKFCRHFLPSQDGTHLEAITETSSQGYEGVCDSYTWMQISTVDKYS